MTRLWWAIAIAACLTTAEATAATLMIDDFQSPDPAAIIFAGFNHPNGQPLQQSELPATIGGQRDVKIDVDGQPVANSAQVLIGYEAELYDRGILQVATASMPGSIVTLQYDGVDEDTSTLTNAHGLNQFVMPDGGITIDFLSVDAPAVGLLDVAIRMYSNGAVATYSGHAAETGTPTSLVASFAEFDVGDGFSFNSIDSFEFVFNGSALVDVDFAIDQITTVVPEPSALWLAGAGICAAACARFRRR